MENQDNAYVETESENKLIGGKFKDVNALFDAYNALQAEFTRRSQKLKALEKENKDVETCEKSVEKPQETVESEATPLPEVAENEGTEGTEKVGEKDGFRQKTDENNVAESKKFTDDEILALVQGNEAVTKKIIGDYLLGTRKNFAPLMKGGNGGVKVSVAKPKTISTAGSLALNYFKNGNK